MFEQLFKRDDTVARYRAAPLTDSRLGHLAHCAAQGAKPYTLRTIAVMHCALVRYADLEETGPVPLSQVEAAADRWLAEEPGRRDGNAERARRRFVRHATGWLRFDGRLEAPCAPPHPTDSRLAAFTDYMRRERGWSESTIRYRRRQTGEFLRRCWDRGLPLERVTLADIDRELAAKRAKDGWSRHSLRTYAGSLRAFLRYAGDQGWCARELAAAVQPPRVYAGEGLPTGPAWEDVERLLAATEGDGPADVRNRAILLLLARYGLRAGEVCGLRLEDIDWEAESLTVRRPKPGRPGRYPLARSAGDAILRYLRDVRPRRASRAIFLTLVAPVRPLTPDAISEVVRSRMERLGIDSRRRGSHALRHAFAQHLLDEGFSMKEIGDCLGHRSPASTAAYAKADLAGLRQVADFDPEWLS